MASNDETAPGARTAAEVESYPTCAFRGHELADGLDTYWLVDVSNGRPFVIPCCLPMRESLEAFGYRAVMGRDFESVVREITGYNSPTRRER